MSFHKIDGVYVIINNIPKSYHSSHLRNFFSSFTETGGFICFHYRHRPEIQKPSNPADESDCKKSRFVSNCCVVKIDANRVNEFIDKYNGEHWLDSKGETLATCCFIKKINLTEDDGSYCPESKSFKKGTVATNLPLDREQFSVQDVESLLEMNPPTFMPNGNVGTKTSHFLNEIRSCRMPPSLISKLGLQFPRNRSRRIYGSVAFDYRPKKERLKSKKGFSSKPNLEPVYHKKPWCPRIQDEEKRHDDSDNEKYWDAKEGDFDAKTSDDWDIDMRVYEGPALDSDKDIKKFGEWLEENEMGIGRKLLEAHGWKQGQGVGRNAAGIAEPLPNEGQLPSDKKGFGFRGEKLNRQPIQKKRKHRHNFNDSEDSFFISTIYDNPNETDPPESVFTSSSYSKLKYRQEFLKERL
ncbi:g patch domain-containing protein 3 [Trichonephila inaurata madagascariensis]|uniref:G patch domain-containing protein 3 n=1 Tax=Trichonephila inaurata madagascariensis TaxID=2747483 RepID=A0A8X6I2J8_9ARAC|nr:g patch domain-containing protein 3 [Trichonephila inaurata madagascariensis]